MRSRRRRNKEASRPQEAETKAPVANGSGSPALGSAVGVNSPLTDDVADRAFWPELGPGREQEAISTGRGMAYRRMADMRLAIRAVSDGFPVPREAVERLVFDVWRTATETNNPVVERQRAQKLLARMVERNLQPSKLPQQVDGAVLSYSYHDMRQPLIDIAADDLDMREYKVVPGSEDDYAE